MASAGTRLEGSNIIYRAATNLWWHCGQSKSGVSSRFWSSRNSCFTRYKMFDLWSRGFLPGRTEGLAGSETLRTGSGHPWSKWYTCRFVSSIRVGSIGRFEFSISPFTSLCDESQDWIMPWRKGEFISTDTSQVIRINLYTLICK